MILSLCICHFTYLLICSFSKPTALTQYLFAQKCLPRYRLFSSKFRSNIFMALLPFKKPMSSEIECFGGINKIKWIWSIRTFFSSIAICFHSQSCLKDTIFLTASKLARMQRSRIACFLSWCCTFGLNLRTSIFSMHAAKSEIVLLVHIYLPG